MMRCSFDTHSARLAFSFSWKISVFPLGLSLLLFAAIPICSGQTETQQQRDAPSPSIPAISRAQDGHGYILRLTTREVVVEVVARDRDNRPINDLKADDFQVFEGTHKDPAHTRRISGFRLIDPDSEAADDAHKSPVVLPLGGRCEIRTTVHYELAFHPVRWSSGIHILRVTTTRKHSSLSYRSQFYLGTSDLPQHASVEKSADIDVDLMRAACYHPDGPDSILLSLTEANFSGPGTSRYILKIPPESLALAGIDEQAKRVQLDYGICSFSRSGRILGSWRSSVDKPLDAQDLPTVLDTGWTEEINVPRHGVPALTRLVVRDPSTGNLGSIDVAGERPNRLKKAFPSRTTDPHQLLLPADVATEASEEVGGRLSLGSPVPAPNSLCGDVYELPQTTTFLPQDFKTLNAVGAIYADSLSVPERILPQGIPGSTPRSDWFGVDYYGEFWITKPGKYEFVLSADDGADLYIDERRIIDDDGIHPPQTVSGSVNLAAGRHTIHLPYFQGPTFVSLALQVKPPDGTLDVFDLRNYARPSSVVSPLNGESNPSE
jgi:PA14 domain